MARDFLRFVPRPSNLAKALKKITVGGLFAATGLGGTVQAEAVPTVAPADPDVSLVDRAKKVGKLVLRLPGPASSLVAQHRSHRSHSSHRSHYSSSSGGGTAAIPAPAPTVKPAVPAVPPAAPVEAA